MRIYALLSAAAVVAGCNTVPAYHAQPMQTAQGGLGFSVRGIAAYTRDEVKVEREVRKVLEASCGGPIELTEIVFTDASNAAGVPHLAYAATATCVE